MQQISVIIPTYNGALKLPAILQALASQSLQPLEIVVAIDGSTDDTLSVVEEWKKKLPILRTVIQTNSGRASIRNAGAKATQGDLLVFFDDDMQPAPECLAIHAAHHQMYPGSVLTGAQIDISGDNRSEVQNFKAALSIKWAEPLKKLEGSILNKENLFLTAANFSISKNLFFELDGFDERLSDAEDFDLAARAHRSAIPLYFNYNAFAWHNDLITASSYIKRQREYSRSHRFMATIKPWLEQEGYLRESTRPGGWRKYVYELFLFNSWIKAIDQNRLRFLPKKVRYKLYDIIITANGVYFPNKVSLD